MKADRASIPDGASETPLTASLRHANDHANGHVASRAVVSTADRARFLWRALGYALARRDGTQAACCLRLLRELAQPPVRVGGAT
jgi:hypothetical protein